MNIIKKKNYPKKTLVLEIRRNRSTEERDDEIEQKGIEILMEIKQNHDQFGTTYGIN